LNVPINTPEMNTIREFTTMTQSSYSPMCPLIDIVYTAESGHQLDMTIIKNFSHKQLYDMSRIFSEMAHYKKYQANKFLNNTRGNKFILQDAPIKIKKTFRTKKHILEKKI